MKPHVLIVDDDEDILELLKYNLEREGFKVRTLAKSHRTMRVAREFAPDLIILDIMMPNPNGIDLCRQLRGHKRFENTYIFFLTAASEDYMHESAMGIGGDDYIEKMMGLRTLTFKVKSVLKNRFVIRRSVTHLEVGGITVRRKACAVTVRGHDVALSRNEFEMLFFMAQNSGRLISCDNLLRLVWGIDQGIGESTLNQLVEGVNGKSGTLLIEKLPGHQFRFPGLRV